MERISGITKQDTIETAYALGQLVAVAGDFYDVLSNVAIGYRDSHLATGEDAAPPPAYTGSSQLGPIDVVVAQPDLPADQERRRRERERHWTLILGVLNEIRSVSDNLIAETVGEARRDGMVWSQIADALEVTRQAAHKRYGSPSAVYNEVSGDITEI